MQQQSTNRTVLIIIGVVSLSLILGCRGRERVVTYDITKSGKDWVENETIQERRTPSGKVIKEKQTAYERVKCIGKHGKTIAVDSPEVCIKAGGRLVDELMVEEQTIKTKR